MFIFVKTKDEILKYEVVFDKDVLSKLKYEIIDKCSLITHFDYKDTNLPKMYGIDDYLKYRNYSEIKVGIREYNDFYSTPEDLYRIIYDKYTFPYLIELINKLLDNDINVLKEIYNINYKKEILSIDEKIERQKKLIEDLDNSKVDKKIEELEKLKVLIKQKDLNKNQVNVNKYYSKVKGIISFYLVDRISYREVKRVCNFYDQIFDVQYINDIKKYIKIK